MWAISYLVPFECRWWISFNLNCDVAYLICKTYINTEWSCKTEEKNTYRNTQHICITHNTKL